MRDVDYGWMLRYAHMNGASMFFALLYIHMFRGLYYGSYKQPRELLWILGVIILILAIMTAFMGYVLPWGQMSYWAATVITNLFSAIPLIGQSIVTFLWGGFTVGNPTLNRFYALHYLLPFVILAVVLLHLIALHRFGSNNPLRDRNEGAAGYAAVPPLFHDQGSARNFTRVTIDELFLEPPAAVGGVRKARSKAHHGSGSFVSSILCCTLLNRCFPCDGGSAPWITRSHGWSSASTGRTGLEGFSLQ